jgi:cation:H+ antiporter
MILIWIIVFIVSLILLVKGSDWLLQTAEKIGLSLGMSPFIVGVTIVAIGTSFPELITSFVAISSGINDFVIANAVGSNIANIFLIGGVSAIVAKRLQVTKDLIDLDLPLIALTTTIFLFLAYDGKITPIESLFLVFTFIIYLSFSLTYRDSDADKIIKRPKVLSGDYLLLIFGIIALSIGSKYLIDSVTVLSQILNIAPGIIAISAVAIGTSLPELIVSIKAAIRRQSEIALGNIFGSNVFNILMVVGLPGLFGTLLIDSKTFAIGLPMLIGATLLFVISGISKRIHIQEGSMFLVLYALFIAKLFDLF